MRTIEELERAALTLRSQLLKEDKPLGTFVITQEEGFLLKMQPLPYQDMFGLPDTFCGLKVSIV